MKCILVCYDNDSYISWFPQGIAYIASILKKLGVDVTIYNQDVYHYPDEHLTKLLDKEYFDMIGVSIIAGYYQYRKLLKISEAINKSKNRPKLYVIGGHGPAPEPEFFINKTSADVVVIGEGEETALELIEYLEGKKKLSEIKGIAYKNERGKVVINERRPLIKDIDKIPFPAYELFPMDHYTLLRAPHIESRERAIPMLSGRGCKFRCNFCYRMDKGFRPRSPESILEEIKLLQNNYNINYFIFSDELLMSSEERVVSLCESFLKSKLKFKWCCNGRLNYAKKDILQLMKKAGCVFINYGIEAVDDEVLRNMNKALTVKQIIKGVEETLEAGISPGLNIIWGNIGDNLETLKKGVDFLLKYDDHAQLRTIRPVTPYPGSDLYYHAINNSLLKDIEDFYENKHINSDLVSVNFTDLSDEEFHRALYEANTKLINKHMEFVKEKYEETCKKLYLEKDASFRGFRHT